MIIKMTRVRIIGARRLLQSALRELQRMEVVQLAEPRPSPGLDVYQTSPRDRRTSRHLERMLDDAETALSLLTGSDDPTSRRPLRRTNPDFPRWARTANRVRREAERLANRRAALEEEKQFIAKYQHLFHAFEPFQRIGHEASTLRPFYFLMRPDQGDAVTQLREHLDAIIRDEFEYLTHRLPTGEVALLLLVPMHRSAAVERVLEQAAIQPIPTPTAYGGNSLASALPKMEARLRAIPEALRRVDRRRRHLSKEHEGLLRSIAVAAHDRLLESDARERASLTPRAFVLEGWLPSASLSQLRTQMKKAFDNDVTVQAVSTQEWAAEDAPVVLSNPRLFRPFEVVTRLLPLPQYGSMDPTPFVAVFFPMFFGIVLGDIGYGIVLAATALVLRLRSRRHTVLRAVSEIGLACATFATIFGALYGELFGDLGHRWFGMRPVLMDREESIVPFLALAVAIGFVHVLLGLVLGVVSTVRREPRKAIGRSVAAGMVVLVALALLAALEVLPRELFTPSVVAVLVLFPILVIVEGILAPLKLMSTVSNILSYTRIMAIGTASVMMAVTANRLAGAMGSVLVGLLFGLLFHLVNFILGVFSPTIHLLRLHYVEFFSKFYSPGGAKYEPFMLWHPPNHSARA